MRKDLFLPGLAVAGGIAGFGVRRWQLASAYNPDTQLFSPGAAATWVLLALIAGLAVFFVLILTCTSLYLQWTAPYASYISGIQGRYFLPLLLPLYLALCPRPEAGAAALPGSPANPGLPDRALLVGVNVCACLNLLLAAGPVGLL